MDTKTRSPSKSSSSSLLIGVPGVNVPEMPAPLSPVDIKKLIRKASRARMRPPKIHLESEQGPFPRVISGRSSGEASPAILPRDIRTHDGSKGRVNPEHMSLGFDVPLAASPLLRAPNHASPLELRLDDYFTRKRGTSTPAHSRPSVTFDAPQASSTKGESSNPSSPTKEKRRRYRQTLVDIKDDDVFHQVLEDLARIESQTPNPDDQGEPTEHSSEPNILEMKPTKGLGRSPSRLISDRKAREESIRAWFVTREIVQGERRYGRLLARGVAVRLTTSRMAPLMIDNPVDCSDISFRDTTPASFKSAPISLKSR